MSDLIVIFRTHSDVEANIVRGLLDAHGIKAMLSSDVPHSVFPLTINGLGEVRLTVRDTDADDALRIIEDHRADVSKGEVVRLRDDFAALEDRLGYRFRQPQILERALTHRSLANEDATGAIMDNESLEFLGDAVLGFSIADTLFRRFPEYDEGQKSKLKSLLVSTPTLARLARQLELGEFLMLGRGEEKTGGRRKQALLADGYEAVIAAVYVDGGIEAARAFIARQFATLIDEVREPTFGGRDHKSALQEYLQGHEQPLPEYLVASESGPDHRKLFQVEVRVRDEVIAQASGRSKKEAEQEAARAALEKLTTKAEG
ncbi:MAG: ribonuclease III [Bacteroidales bacterium]